MKHSDNLTDLVEHLQDDKSQKPENPENKAWELRNDDGELIKLDDHFNSNRTNKF